MGILDLKARPVIRGFAVMPVPFSELASFTTTRRPIASMQWLSSLSTMVGTVAVRLQPQFLGARRLVL